jgi:hypothetical protein
MEMSRSAKRRFDRVWIAVLGLMAAAVGLEAAITVDHGAVPPNNIWRNGLIREFRWSADIPLTGQVRLELRNYGSTATVREIAAQAPNSGHFRWKVPADIPQAFYRVRVTFLQDGQSADSDVFMIFPNMRFTYPPDNNTQTSLMRGKAHTLTWEWVGPDAQYLNFKAAFNNGPMVTIADNVPNTGSFVWNIPDDLQLGSFRLTYQIPSLAYTCSWCKITPKMEFTPPPVPLKKKR